MPNQQFNHETMITQVESKLKKKNDEAQFSNQHNVEERIWKKNIFSLKKTMKKKTRDQNNSNKEKRKKS
jgi:hypothetical protein